MMCCFVWLYVLLFYQSMLRNFSDRHEIDRQAVTQVCLLLLFQVLNSYDYELKLTRGYNVCDLMSFDVTGYLFCL